MKERVALITKTVEVRVWDPFIRVSHWLLAAAIFVDWFTDKPRWMHVWLGYLAAMLVVMRVLWGFVGSEHARFADFVSSPRRVLGYLAELTRFSSKRYLGHSPAGGAMIIALLFMVAVTAGTGMVNLAQDEGAGPLAGVISKVERPARIPGQKRPPLLSKQVHETAANITLLLVILHILGVAFASFAHNENLARSMITGQKKA